MLEHWIWLSLTKSVSDGQKRMLVEYFSDAEAVYSAREEQLAEACELSGEAVACLMDKDLDPARDVLDQCARKKISVLAFNAPEYPVRLKNIYDPPVVLYYKGTLPDFDAQPAIGMVGTRHPSAYGFEAACRLGYEVAAGGGLVVSGMAMGIDAAAMNGALAAGKPAVGVLGCGADVVYPKCNSRLFDDTERCGCILSEYAPGTPAGKWTFPRRNRIISGLSCGVVVVEGPEHSGSLITARHAGEQGRDVYAVPGNIDMPGFIGSNRLLREGAIAVSTGWDVLSEYETLFPGKLKKAQAAQKLLPFPAPDMGKKEQPAKVAQQAELPKGKANLNKPKDKKAIDKAHTAPYIDVADTLTGLSPDEQAIVTALGEEERLVDEVIAASGLSSAKVLSLLTMLEIKGIIQRHPGRHVSLKAGKH